MIRTAGPGAAWLRLGAGFALILIGSAQIGHADPSFVPVNGEMRCFSATYQEPAPVGDTAVTSIFLSLEDGEYGTYFWLDAEFRDKPGEVFIGGGTCRLDDGEFECPIDCDGGSFVLETAPDGGVKILADYGLRLEGPSEPVSADDEDENRNFISLPATNPDAPYILQPVADEDCTWDESPS